MRSTYKTGKKQNSLQPHKDLTVPVMGKKMPFDARNVWMPPACGCAVQADKTTCGSSGRHRRQRVCRLTQNELKIKESCKFIFSIQCESSLFRIFHLEHRSQRNPAPGKRLAKLRYMAGHFLPAVRITGVWRRFSDMSANHLQYMRSKMDRRSVFERARRFLPIK